MKPSISGVVGCTVSAARAATWPTAQMSSCLFLVFALAACTPCESTLHTLLSENSKIVQCCGDSRQYQVAQVASDLPMDVYVQVGSAR
jgi:hypothetical protein